MKSGVGDRRDSRDSDGLELAFSQVEGGTEFRVSGEVFCWVFSVG